MNGDVVMVAVVIGRNEGKRLELSLRSVQAAGLPAIYIDSGSTDDSVGSAKTLGIPVLELDAARPFTAARSRNEGLEAAVRRWPVLRYILFLDADCILDPKFPEAAAQLLDKEAKLAIVTGHLSERHPERSIYNRLCSIEWRSPAGRMENLAALGGIMAARASAVTGVGGFNEQVIAGEDAELGARIKLAGYAIEKIDCQMATHDAELMRFGQWWKRAVRGGHALAQRYFLNGRSRLHDCRREFFSTLFWGLAIPILIVLLLWPTGGLSLLLLGGYALLGWRVYRHFLQSGLSRDDALLAARFTIYAKFANLVGVFRYFFNSLRGSFRIIEYKTGQ